MVFFQNGLTPPTFGFGTFESLFPKFINKNFKNNLFTVFSLLAHWHLFAFDCFRAKKKKVTQNCWIGRDPPPTEGEKGGLSPPAPALPPPPLLLLAPDPARGRLRPLGIYTVIQLYTSQYFSKVILRLDIIFRNKIRTLGPISAPLGA